ncbi:hypothetical protein [Fusibacter sp. 3D3]|uniref:hypothetical protein n=1 Tax=Fusibacter sp. 3D3 TaxID=1048380 RepID=UPI000852ED62|nr:hypothetical protein [Fusibacter sp. 3D3]GAU77520.1 hypothetical protein F3D3_2149 [Fusibacter sp. 3D3]
MKNKNIDTILFDAGGILIYIKAFRNSIISRILLSMGYDAEHVDQAIVLVNHFDRQYLSENSAIVCYYVSIL